MSRVNIYKSSVLKDLVMVFTTGCNIQLSNPRSTSLSTSTGLFLFFLLDRHDQLRRFQCFQRAYHQHAHTFERTNKRCSKIKPPQYVYSTLLRLYQSWDAVLHTIGPLHLVELPDLHQLVFTQRFIVTCRCWSV